MYAVWFRGVHDTRPWDFAQDWPELREHLTRGHVHRKEKGGPLWSPVAYRPNIWRRANKNIEHVACLTIDLDSHQLPKLDGLEYVAYTTYSHLERDPHWHLVIPLAEPVPANRWKGTRARYIHTLGLDADPATCDPSRAFYLPQTKRRNGGKVKTGTGDLLGPVDPMKVYAAHRAGDIEARYQFPAAEWDDDPTQWLLKWGDLKGRALYRQMLKDFRELRAAG